ncbi:MAG: bifunctional proline dehydrogenase/L-glutamate gamma-semialdehyde dehydrogenase PutA [Hyphomicrobiales bacterium]|nr:bifunctional proline dehydrogenase/L-glutamate gamma-semialdehyde dehydrogenase PutA [Hyphomicrobiales bacterium]
MQDFRKTIRNAHLMPESDALQALLQSADLDASVRKRITERAVDIVRHIRDSSDPGMMELFLSEYGLSSDEGVALMCLAEALLRVPDGSTIDALIDDKIAPSAWGQHLGKSHSSLVNATTWALFITGKVLDDDSGDNSMASLLHGAIKRLGEPVIRQAVTRVMKELGGQFVLGETIESAMDRAEDKEQEGFTYSYDMLGEAAHTEADAKRYHIAYSDAISHLARASNSLDIRQNPGISIKLSALHPRYETLKKQRVMDELVPRARSLAILAKSADIGLNIDAEEAGRLDLSLDIIEAILKDPVLRGWDGFGVVVQAYGQRAPYVLDWLYDLAKRLDRKIMVRLVKGAYWDTEIKHAQVEGLEGYPVFTQKPSTDVSFICCAKKLLGMTDRIYPQFATHNAHTVSAILELADDTSKFEFQRLHGMGEALHDAVLKKEGTRCSIYAPVGAHRELLAYLVRRLLENGANSSFVNQIVDEDVPPEEVAVDPFGLVEAYLAAPQNPNIRQPADLFAPQRRNSRGFDLEDPETLARLQTELVALEARTWSFDALNGAVQTVYNPANGERVGTVAFTSREDVEAAIGRVSTWQAASPGDRAEVLREAADLYEANAAPLFSLLMREAGKTLLDCVGELREAVDFLRYYAAEVETRSGEPAGIFTCISPWNFPLAIFSGQIAAALATGNGVLAKPAESTSLIAEFAVSLLHQAGVPKDVLILLPGTGAEVGHALTSNAVVDGVCFTGSTQTAQLINRTMAAHLAPHAPLIAETGGLNAMIVDSTALPEQAITDIVASAFQSAGQRCSALRVLYLQEDIAEPFLKMLYGAMDELVVGDPKFFDTDIGPLIDATAQSKITAYVNAAKNDERLLKQISVPESGYFVAPSVISVAGIEDLGEEIFGPVLHVATFKNDAFDKVIDRVNAKGFGLTFGLHSRIDERVQLVIDRVAAGNIYVNRNQIGAVVGCQPFGGEGLSGTGPKAGGPRYLARFTRQERIGNPSQDGKPISAAKIEEAFTKQARKIDRFDAAEMAVELPGPTGESNRYFVVPRKRVLCLGPSAADAELQAERARALGCNAIAVAPGCKSGLDGIVSPEALGSLEDLDAIVCWAEANRSLREVLAARSGAIVPLISEKAFEQWLVFERHACIDTTAAGGNVALLGG